MKAILQCVLLLASLACAFAEEPVASGFFVGPSSTSITGGKASLIIGALLSKEGTYIGEYKLKVAPYFWMSENGKLIMSLSDASVLTLAKGVPVTVTGKATTNDSGKNRVVIAKLTPATKENGSVTFFFTGEKTKLIFTASYRLGKH